MPLQTISIGASANDGTGDSLRAGGDKINDNFTELYSLVLTIENSISAAGTVQADATALASGEHVVHRVSTATSNQGVRLPVATAGQVHHVYNNTNVQLKVYPASGDQLGTASVDASITLAQDGPTSSGTSGAATFIAIDSTKWLVFYNAIFSTSTPAYIGAAAPGGAILYSRSDHIHPQAVITAQPVGGTLTTASLGTTFTNEGATSRSDFVLPTAATGQKYTFYVPDADGIRVTAASGDTIRLGSAVSAAAGYAESTTIGSSITLEAINATEWVAVSLIGTWSVVCACSRGILRRRRVQRLRPAVCWRGKGRWRCR
jgi:hypothetical protein